MSSTTTQSYINKKFRIAGEENTIFEVYSQRGNVKIYFWNVENNDEAYNIHYEDFQKKINLEEWVFV